MAVIRTLPAVAMFTDNFLTNFSGMGYIYPVLTIVRLSELCFSNNLISTAGPPIKISKNCLSGCILEYLGILSSKLLKRILSVLPIAPIT